MEPAQTIAGYARTSLWETVCTWRGGIRSPAQTHAPGESIIFCTRACAPFDTIFHWPGAATTGTTRRRARA